MKQIIIALEIIACLGALFISVSCLYYGAYLLSMLFLVVFVLSSMVTLEEMTTE